MNKGDQDIINDRLFKDCDINTITRTPVSMARNKKKTSSAKAATSPGVKTRAVDLVTGKETVQYFFDPSLLILNKNDDNNQKNLNQSIQRLTAAAAAKNKNSAQILESKHLFVPCTIIKPIDDDDDATKKTTLSSKPYPGPTLVKTEDGTLHKISDSTKLTALQAPDDYVGVNDVLHLSKISEASLLHTLRTRYKRDDVYTQAGQILISINPYKALFIKDPMTGTMSESIYSENQMILYRSAYETSPFDFVSGSNNKCNQPQRPHLFQLADRAYTALMDSVHISRAANHLEDDDAVMFTEARHRPGHILDQSIIISGESGAGKTEATKIIMQFLARMTRSAEKNTNEQVLVTNGSKTSKEVSSVSKADNTITDKIETDEENTQTKVDSTTKSLEERVLSCNPLLETFGNAQTLRNNNSSRFGKFIRIDFSTDTGTIVGASISNYLLEKTRITTQVDGERNYHIFYQLLAGASADLKEKLFGSQNTMSSYQYLGKRPDNSIDQKIIEADARQFKETRDCLASLDLSDAEQEGVFAMAAGVLHLGNIEFEECAENDAESSKIKESSMESVDKACELLSLNKVELMEAILTKTITVNGKIIKKAQNVIMAADKRDALAKMTYSSLFLWLVKCINDRLDESSKPVSDNPMNKSFDSHAADRNVGFIGVLDIYGFEFFDVNGFEQFLINYCNEKLQRHFNRHLFEVEQELYANEGVDWSYISFNDNRPCLELIEGGGLTGGIGILNSLDDAWGGMGTTTEKDGKFVTQLHKMFGSTNSASSDSSKKNATKENESSPDGNSSGHSNFVTPKFGSDRQFLVIHYAGEVRYTVDGFVERNMETLSNELKELGENAVADIPKRVYSIAASTSKEPATPNAIGSSNGNNTQQRSSIRGTSVSSQFRTSLHALVTELESTQPHYIRCIKPNLDKAPSRFIAGEVLKQLRYSGMMEAIRIRQEGYALREDHQSFFERFNVLLTTDDIESEGGAGILQLVKALSKRLKVSDADWQVGHSKIFLRHELSEKLERLAKLRVLVAARTLTRFGSQSVRKRLAKFLVSWTRFQLRMLKKKKIRRAANKISSQFRCYQQRRVYKRVRNGFIGCQASVRRKLACRRVRKIRDPYCDMSFREVKQVLANVQAKLDQSIKDKDFRKAALLEGKIAKIKEAVERKRPVTRAFIDEQIATVQAQFDDAMKRKAFSECAPLQDKLDELSSKRSELPTLAELRERVHTAEADMTMAAKNRDFAGAADAQSKIDEAKQKLMDALAAQDDEETTCGEENGDKENLKSIGCESRSQLESDIATITHQIEAAIAAKDFRKASTLQTILDDREKLRTMFPTIGELLLELKSLKLQVEEAIANKEFGKAGTLSETIEKLEEKIEKEKANMSDDSQIDSPMKASFIDLSGQEICFSSRVELDKHIKSMSDTVSSYVKEKKFKMADQLQSDVDKMTKLKEFLPSIEELRSKIKILKADTDNAIAVKKFAKADELHNEMERLEQRLESEIAAMPQPSPEAVVSVLTSRKLDAKQSTTFSSPKPVSATSKSLVDTATRKEGQNTSHRTVAKLRPSIPLCAQSTDSILSIAKIMTGRRSNSCIVLGDDGLLSGIITDTDITRRVVAKNVNPASTLSSQVMTGSPTCVTLADSAMDALTTMVVNHFRHLPVLDENGAVAGVLDIAKCLDDAITKLEHVKRKDTANREQVMKEALKNQGTNAPQARALQALLGSLLSQTMGNAATPTLRILLDKVPKTIIAPTASIREAGILMSERRKATLIVEKDQLLGIFSFRDMMMRAVATEVDLDTTPVSKVMTAHPETVSPDITVLEALQIMHDTRFMTLPVCENDGKVIGLVDVMDVIYGCGGADGWKSVFSSALEVQDDASDTHSVTSMPSTLPQSTRSTKAEQKHLGSFKEIEDARPVSFLRPSKPVLSAVDDSVLQVAKNLTMKRASASLIIASDGGLAGILTGSDITRRIIAKYIEPTLCSVSSVMTKNPECIVTTDPAMDAITTMVEKNFRHLPVIDKEGQVVGLLDIAKCLNAVIGKLERSEKKKNGSKTDASIKRAIAEHGAVGQQAVALQLLLSSVLSNAFGQKSAPTLRELIGSKLRTIVTPETNVRTAGLLMAERRQAALILDENERLVGIFGFKDMMTRVVAKELVPESIPIVEVMTPNPESVSPDMTVLEALQTMHDNKFLTLPVCESDGRVLGVVNVMDVIIGCGGSEGWRSIFSSLMDATEDASESGSVSIASPQRSRSTATPTQPTGSTVSLQPSTKSILSNTLHRRSNDKSVAKLRPSKPNLSGMNDTILSVTQLLQQKRGSASLIVDDEGRLCGILTDTDVTRRVVANCINAASVSVSSVMTKNPKCVNISDSASEALKTMVENHFRHLPVVDDNGSVVGLLDIAKCINDAISKLETAEAKGRDNSNDAIQSMINQQNGADPQAAALHALLSDLLSKAFGGNQVPTLRSVLANKPATTVAPSTSVQEAAILMAERRKAALIVDHGVLVGIFGFKDMMTRAVAKELDLETTEVSAVMTPNPETVTPDITVLEALQTMHDHHILTLPVCEEDGSVVGLVDVMDVMHGCGGADGWKSIFNDAMDLDDSSVMTESISKSVHSRTGANPTMKSPTARTMPATPFATVLRNVAPDYNTPYALPPNIPTTLEFEDGDGADSLVGSTIGEGMGISKNFSGEELSIGQENVNVKAVSMLVFKLLSPSGETHRIRSKPKINDLLALVSLKIGATVGSFLLRYEDEEGDPVTMTIDDDIVDAWNTTRSRNGESKILKIAAVLNEENKKMDSTNGNIINDNIVAVAAGVVATVAIIGFVLFRPRH